MSYWNGRSYFASGQSGNNEDGYGSAGDQQYEANGGKNKRSSSRLKKSGKKDADAVDEYPNYTTRRDDSHDDNHYNRNSKDYRGGNPYNGGGYGGNSPYAYGANGGGYAPYNAPSPFWAPQDGNRSPLIITREVNMYGMPGSQYDNDSYSDQRRQRGGGGGFFGPAFHAVGHLFDRKFGFNDRD